MKYIGPHVHTTGGTHNAPENARAVGATGFGLFVKNQRQWAAKPFEAAVIDSFKKNMELFGYGPAAALAHAGYLINIGSPYKDSREKSVNALINEAQRCELLGLTLLNIHPGSSLNAISINECISNIAKSINIVLAQTSGVTIVLETTAGQGSNIGGKFEHLADIINEVNDKTRVGVCIDTCHIFAAGYDIRDALGYEAVMREFDRTVGFKYIRGLHLNDAKNAHGSRTDRHESIGRGNIGPDAFRMLMKDTRFNGIPCVLETPNEEIWANEVETLQKWAD